ncbi:hypothetical protein [Cytobacillus horneckiae]|uniref:hypothetical protein n=1 Tax=Cytobacillus horneckiae TaxID=549687 RepID=UPI00203C56EE|nr:hypothetical protein [Cytobacillus horneckiae]MCM3179728.1 hypothetical protein [Cytobacillus horneckiae]
MDNEKKASECLSASLTLLVELGILEKQVVMDTINVCGYEGLFQVLNDKFIEVKNR